MRKCYATKRLFLRIAEPSFAWMASEFFLRNKENLERHEERKPDEFFLPEFQELWLGIQREKADKGEWYSYYLFKKGKPKTIIGTVSISQIQYGNLESGVISYRIDNSFWGKGFGSEAAAEATRIGFEELKLHRMEADVMPDNKASIKVLEKCGYEREGYFRKYLKINGKWEDHIHMAAVNNDEKNRNFLL